MIITGVCPSYFSDKSRNITARSYVSYKEHINLSTYTCHHLAILGSLWRFLPYNWPRITRPITACIATVTAYCTWSNGQVRYIADAIDTVRRKQRKVGTAVVILRTRRTRVCTMLAPVQDGWHGAQQGRSWCTVMRYKKKCTPKIFIKNLLINMNIITIVRYYKNFGHNYIASCYY